MFVSIVSTKIPFKGAGKEYIGDDIEEMVAAVKHAIQACGVQVGGWVLGRGADPVACHPSRWGAGVHALK